MKLRAIAVIVILIGAMLASGCCVCCVPCGTTRSQGMANDLAQPGAAPATSDPAVLQPLYTGSI